MQFKKNNLLLCVNDIIKTVYHLLLVMHKQCLCYAGDFLRLIFHDSVDGKKVIEIRWRNSG